MATQRLIIITFVESAMKCHTDDNDQEYDDFNDVIICPMTFLWIIWVKNNMCGVKLSTTAEWSTL